MGEYAEEAIEYYLNKALNTNYKRTIKRMAKAKTTYHKFTGTIGWNHLVEPDDYLGEKKYVLDFYPDDYQAIRNTGSKLKLDRNTSSYVRPRRDYEKDFGNGTMKLDPPELTMADGSAFDRMYIPKGSKVEITVALYDAGRFGKGTRLQAVKILELVEEPEEAEEVEVVVEVKEEVVAPKKGKKPSLPF